MRLTLEDVLGASGTSLTEEDVALTLQEALTPERSATARARPLSRDEIDTLREVSGLNGDGQRRLQELLDDPGEAQRLADIDEARWAVRLLATSIPLEAAASQLQVHRTTVTRRVKDCHLYVAPGPTGPRLPTWQFSPRATADEATRRWRTEAAHGVVDLSPLPGLTVLPWVEEIVPHIPKDMHPLTVESIMTTPAEATDGIPPVDWLDSGGSPDVVIVLLQDEAWLP